MTMIRVTVGETVVTWSPEYGFTIAGGEAKVEEIEPRGGVVNVPVFTKSDLERLVEQAQPHLTSVPLDSSGDDDEPAAEPIPASKVRTRKAGPRGKCGMCNHPMHGPDECTLTINLGDGVRVPCDCSAPFEEAR